MPRPSRNTDQALLEAGLALLPETGCRDFSVRQLAERAGVNPGMFHYHFRTRDVFVRAVLERVYEEMFAQLELEADPGRTPVDNLRGILRTLGRFALRHRLLMTRLVSESIAGEPLPAEFLKTNVPRHLRLVAAQVAAGQRAGSLRRLPMPQALAFIFGGVAAPVLFGTAMLSHDFLPPGAAADVDDTILTDKALCQRIELVLRGLSTPKEEAA